MPLHGFVIPRCGYFIKYELSSSPKGREFDQQIAKKFKCRTFPVPPPPSVLTLIPVLLTVETVTWTLKKGFNTL